MKVQILGAHGLESKETRFVSLLVDGVLALDAGGIATSLSLPSQEKIKFVLLTHSHMDHIQGLASLAMHALPLGITIEVYGIADTIHSLSTYIFNWTIHPDFTKLPSPERPALKLHTLEVSKKEAIGGYTIFAQPVHHSVPGVGFEVTSKDEKKVFYSGDTGPGLSWEFVSPNLLILDCAGEDKYAAEAARLGHMTPKLLKAELTNFQKLKGHLPPIVLVHMNPPSEKKIKQEVDKIASELNANIELAYEGMEIEL
jgi:ribonuclease BN (tRNA processing enzyme)